MSAVSIGLAVGGAYLQSKAAGKAADAQSAAAASAAEGAKFDPYDITGAFGTGSFANGEASGTLNPNMQLIQDRFGREARQFSQQGQTGIGALADTGAMGFMQAGMQADPYALAQSQFGKMQEMLAPSRGRSRDALEARLMRQGRLGSTGGALSEQAQQTAFGQQDQRMMLDALQQGRADQTFQLGMGQQLGMFGQQQRDVGFNKAQSRLSGIQGMDAQLMSYLQMGGAFGGRQAAAGAIQGQFGMQGAGAQSAALLGGAAGMADAFGTIGSALQGYDWGSSPYNAETGGGTLAAKTDAQWANNWDY